MNTIKQHFEEANTILTNFLSDDKTEGELAVGNSEAFKDDWTLIAFLITCP